MSQKIISLGINGNNTTDAVLIYAQSKGYSEAEVNSDGSPMTPEAFIANFWENDFNTTVKNKVQQNTIDSAKQNAISNSVAFMEGLETTTIISPVSE